MACFDNFVQKIIGETYEVTAICQGMSYRQYKRLTLPSRETYVLMMVPMDQSLEDGQSAIEGVIRPFLHVHGYLKNLGIKVPEVLSVSEEEGFVLLEDLGDKTFYDLYHTGHIDAYSYTHAIDILVKLYNAEKLEGTGEYNERLATIRGDFFLDDYLPAVRGGMPSSVREYEELRQILQSLYEVATDVKWGTILWDFHSPNLMPATEKNDVGVLDFQDAKFGPLSYDLASLLYDARYPFPKDLRDKLFNEFVEKAGVEDVSKFKDSFEICGLLRNLGVVGRFARSAFRDGRSEFVGKIAVLWPYLDEALENPKAAELKAFLERVLPDEREIVI